MLRYTHSKTNNYTKRALKLYLSAVSLSFNNFNNFNNFVKIQSLPMLFKESLESLEETPLKVQKTITNIKLLNNQSEDHINTIKQQIELDQCDLQKIVSAFLRLEENEKELNAHLHSLYNFIDGQTETVELDCNNFDEMVSKSALILKTNQISARELGETGAHANKDRDGAPCYCGKDVNAKMIACDDPNCRIEWFHLSCIGISQPPAGKWYCRECRKRQRLHS
ncbi:Chromatin remodeling protein, contains PHD Zn-finger [Trachipleistophora hominis]|uniref:Chromatin remodeling protein, contains PHD Zn-finger n=1 Tax=Trachipleistophora hominis TaxID=72359 RepID=L7JTQ8_TRAHO|nr:Chromatin remodeling protein, contains PHD Zn-finger [Trachipleistophora hominis]